LWQGAEEFRSAKRQRAEDVQKPGQSQATKRPRKIAFGAGALEETDTFGYMDDYVAEDGDQRDTYAYEIASDEDEPDVLPTGYEDSLFASF
jgi:hypothetical protein